MRMAYVLLKKRAPQQQGVPMNDRTKAAQHGHSGRMGAKFGPGIPQQQAAAPVAQGSAQHGDGNQHVGPVEWDDETLGGHGDHR